MHHRCDPFAKNILRDAPSRACMAETEAELEVLAAYPARAARPGDEP